MAQYITAREALLFFQNPDQLKYLVSHNILPFFMRDRNNVFTKELRGLYESKERNFFEILDDLYFEYNTFNAIINKNKSYILVKGLSCDGKNCPFLHQEGIGDIITIAEARKELGMSRIMFVDLLNDDEHYRLATSYEQQVRDWIFETGYYGSGNIKFFTINMLSNEDLFIERIDWDDFKEQRPGLFGLNTTSDNTCITNQDAKLEELHQRIAELEQQLSRQPAAHSFALWGLPKKIYEMRGAGKTEAEIAQYLKSIALPRKAIGALLRQDDRIIGDYGQWLDEEGLLPKQNSVYHTKAIVVPCQYDSHTTLKEKIYHTIPY